MAATAGSVFEAVDASGDEQYYTCGIWLTLEAAMKAFHKLGDDYPGEDIAEGVKIIEIRERKIGELNWSENGKVVAKFVWRKDYLEADDSYEWRLTETPNVPDQRPPTDDVGLAEGAIGGSLHPVVGRASNLTKSE